MVQNSLILRAKQRERFATALREHFLFAIQCDHATKQDNPICACSRVHLGWHPTVGAAVEAWIEHVLSSLAVEGTDRD